MTKKIKEKKQKRVLIIIRGAKPVHFKNKLLEDARNFVFNKLTSTIGLMNESYEKLAKFFKKDYSIVELLKWNGKITNDPALREPIGELSRLLKKYSNKNIDIIAVSLGGFIAEKTLSQINGIKIKNLLYIGAVHDDKYNNQKISRMINVYSKKDKMFFFTNDIYDGKGNHELNGKNVVNVAFNNVAHDELCSNIELREAGYGGKRLYEVYRDLLMQK